MGIGRRVKLDFFLPGGANTSPLWYSQHAFRQEVPRGLLLEGSAVSGASCRKALARLEPVRGQDPGDDGAGRVRPILQDVKAPALRAYGNSHGLLERMRDSPLPPHKLDPAPELHPPRDVRRHEEPQHLLVCKRPHPRLVGFDEMADRLRRADLPRTSLSSFATIFHRRIRKTVLLDVSCRP